ncbi:Reverse transcriptase domain protein [Ceratobasidium sp. AG-Ba]|nr:Reverse transcriptase domain protein [Ceratobasidium sp. AG-Ba]
MLRALGLLEEFGDIPGSLREGFRIGAPEPVSVTTIRKNHKSSLDRPTVIEEHIQTELAAGRYTGPFDKDTLERLIGPFQTAPLGVVDKPSSPGKFCIIQDFSFPRDVAGDSLNSKIDADEFSCDWGFFEHVVKSVLDAPSGTMAATFDVDAAYRQMPVHPDDQPHIVVHWNGQFWVDHNVPFGAASSNGIFGRCGDAMKAIYTRLGFGTVHKWVDDFLFIQSPPGRFSPSEPGIFNDVQAIYDVADQLGWHWKRSKTRPFSTAFVYLGFVWDIPTRQVSIPDTKRLKYAGRLEDWSGRAKVTLKECQQLLGSLIHCCLVVPEGRPRLANLIGFMAGYPHADKLRFLARNPTNLVLGETRWWASKLSNPSLSLTIRTPPPRLELAVHTDASSSFGLGIILNNQWRAWRLLQGWDKDRRNIGWAEALAVELAISWIAAQGCQGALCTIHCDNQGVVFAWKAGRSRNPPQNDAIMRALAVCVEHDLWIDLKYVNTANNPANRPSCGLRPLGDLTQACDKIPVPASIRHLLAEATL